MKISPRIEIVCIGTELLTGQVNTHTSYLGQKLSTVGMKIAREQTVGDDPKTMEEVFQVAYRIADIVISCGGLGPTFDDITRDVWSRVLHRPLQSQAKLILEIREKFRLRGLQMPEKNKRQAEVLKGAVVIPNANGTAPGQYLSTGEKTLILLPGPARELYPMFEEYVIPRLKVRASSFIVQKNFLSVGIPESKIDEMIRPLVRKYKRVQGCEVTHGILASQSIITVKFSIEGKNQGHIEKAANFLTRKFKKRLGSAIFGEDDDTLSRVIGRLIRLKEKTVAVAESCTGGLIAKLLTDEPGSSDYLVEGVVTYSNKSKQNRLGVKKISLVRYGAVSEQVAKEMAQGLRRRAGVDYSLSTTGIAGPTGGSVEKPVGLVYIGCATPRRTFVKKFQFTGDREWIRHRSSLMALDLLRKELLA